MKKKKILGLAMSVITTMSLLAGCGSDGANNSGADSSNVTGENQTIDVEVWTGNIGFKAVEKDSEVYNFYQDLIGVGITQPYVVWDDYTNQLNLKIAAGEMPDIFLQRDGVDASLIQNGALLDLTDLLPEKAPHLWETIPEDIWNAMKANDPTGQGRIYMVPSIVDYNQKSGLIRQEWLDAVGMDMPQTQEDFVKVLEAFKTQDPNGNGLADELPTGGRAEARWMDHLFAMYGVAINEGYPQWDVYDGELTYSAVTPNMKAALEFCSELYAKGLMDLETLINDKAAWDGKITSDRVGVAFHWSEVAYEWAEKQYNATGIKPIWAVLPEISAPGYEGYYTTQKINTSALVLKNTSDEAVIDAYMKVLDAYGNKDLWMDMYYGVEGMHHEVIDGERVLLPEDKTKKQSLVLAPYTDISTIDFRINNMYTPMIENDATREWSISQSINNMQENQKYGKQIAGDGIPATIYDGYPDINSRVLYVEYASKIITGDYSIDKFDEFVEKWYKYGGQEVTDSAREWYSGTQQ